MLTSIKSYLKKKTSTTSHVCAMYVAIMCIYWMWRKYNFFLSYKIVSPFLFNSFFSSFFRSGVTTRYQNQEMIQHFLRPILRRSICTSCCQRTTLPTKTFSRPFHSTKPAHVPILPIPLFILGALKSGQLVSLVSLSSKTSLTLLPHTFRRGGKADTIAKILAGIPVFGFTLLLLIGLDQVPKQ